MHSVTFCPVISKCIPPAWDPSDLCISIFDLTSPSIFSNFLVFLPELLFIVLPCIGSHDQITFFPSSVIFLINLGRNFSTLPLPKRVIRVIFPDSFIGFRISIILTNSSGSELGPHFIPKGF